jgi:DNA-binding transcriptional MerR regulator
MARRTDCTLRSIRFYEQQGLLSVKQRTRGYHRRYSSHEFERLRLIVELRRAGLSLDEIRSVVQIQRRHATGAAASLELRSVLERQISTIDERVIQLRRIQAELEQLRIAVLACKDCGGAAKFPGFCAQCAKLSVANGDASVLRAPWSHSQ